MEPSLTTIKTLFAKSCNVCAYPMCELKLTDPAWPSVRGEIAHIHGDRPGSARYGLAMTDEQRRHYDNLILLCPNHHQLIDDLDPLGHPPEVLIRMKIDHETVCPGKWASDEELRQFAGLLLAKPSAGNAGAASPPSERSRPRLVVERSDREGVDVVNVGDADAVSIRIDPVDTASDEAFVSLADIAPGRLSAGARWRAGVYAATLDDAGPHVVRLSWADDAGTAYSGEFPL